jgi:tetratricopeptide (TPR) repeat protein
VEGVSLLVFLLHLLAQSGFYNLPVWGQRLGEAEKVPDLQREGRSERQVESTQDPLTRLAQSLARDDGAEIESPGAIDFYRAYALESMGRLEEAVAAYGQCQPGPLDGSATRYAALAAFRQGLLLSQQSRWAEAEPRLHRSISLCRAVPLPALHLSAASLLVRLYQTSGYSAKALHWVTEVVHIARGLGDEPTQARALDTAGDLHKALAQPERALQCYEQSLDLFGKLGNVGAALVAKLDIGALHQANGRWDAAAAWYRACLRDAEESGRTADQAAILYELACLHIHMDEARVAAHLLLRDMALYREMRHVRGADRAGRTLLGLGVWMHRRLTANRLTFRDIERGSATKDNDEDKGDKE